ncbi:MAG: filamentous hemagglutinin N-terminal domain-containing protein [Limnothrix sp. RL_2_0]|nr:filamentous hemagglutinin N-terminal domain-containing protein [Limnothrix sp. RL_2_0]
MLRLHQRTSIFLTNLCLIVTGQAAIAQITPDGTLGFESSVVNQIDVNRQEISGGAQRLSSLFHSFQDFSVPALQEVYFVPDTPVLNIFTRVTGNNTSEILGKLGVDGSSNLFLINPNGIHFGTDASLDVSGSFTASTAERFNFSDGTTFSAINPQDAPLLTVHARDPILDYGLNQATMIVDGQLVAGGDLTLGSEQLEVNSSLQSGRDTILQGQNQLLENGNYTVGGYFFTKDLAGNFVDFVIPHSNVILADGDVELQGSYSGGSLYILAGGSVSSPRFSRNTIEITQGVVSDVNAGLKNGQTIIVNSDGKPHLDVRSAIDWNGLLGGNPGNQSNGAANVTFDNATSGNINWRGINIVNYGGNVVLISNVIEGSPLFQGDISTRRINLSSTSGSGNIGSDGGNLFLATVTGDVLTSQIDSSSSFSLDLGDIVGGNGGNIFLSTVAGDISVSNIDAFSNSSSVSGNVTGGNAGDIFLSTVTGDISTRGGLVTSSSESSSGLSEVIGRDGGNIFFSTVTGDISTSVLQSSSNAFSASENVIGNDGGDIKLSTITGNILTSTLQSSSRSSLGLFEAPGSGDVVGGNGGDITLSTVTGNIRTGGLDSWSSSNSVTDSGSITGGNGGDLTVLTVTGNIFTFFIDSFSKSSLGSTGVSPQPSAGSGDVMGGDGGDIAFSTIIGDISTEIIDSFSDSSSYLASGKVTGGNGGDITLSTDIGNISVPNINSSSESSVFSDSGETNGGNGGNIFLSTGTGNISGNSILDSSSTSCSFVDDSISKLTGGNGGRISISTITGEIVTWFIDSSSFSFFPRGKTVGGNGGDIFLSTVTGNISTSLNTIFLTRASINSSSLNRGDGDGGDGGNINISTVTGDISVGQLNSSSESDTGIGGDGGNIFLSASVGNIATEEIDSSSLSSFSSGFSGEIKDVIAGDGGDITLRVIQGDIITDELINSSSFSNLRNVRLPSGISQAGTAGNISLLSQQGALLRATSEPTEIWAFAASQDGKLSGDGGSVFLGGRDLLSNYKILTQSANTTSGDIAVTGFGDLVIDNLEIITSQTIEIPNPEQNSTRTISVPLGQSGQSGNVNIIGQGNLTMQNTVVASSTQSDSPAGNVSVNSQGLLTIQDNTQLTSNSKSVGSAGDFNLGSNTGILITGTDTELSATTSDIGAAGNFALTAPTITIDDNASLSTSTTATGDAGSILINAKRLNLRNGGEILSFSEGAGDGGRIDINATESVTLERVGIAPLISVETSNAGKAGNIEINTPRFTLSETARITATATETATNPEGGGSITIGADQMNLAGVVGIFAETQGDAPAGRLLLKPYQNNPNLDIDLFAGSKISAATSGSGNGGDLVVTAPNNVDISGAGILSVETSSSGDAGIIAVTSKNLALRDGVTLSASTAGSGDGGFIKFTIAGDINIFDSVVQAITKPGSTGKGGSIDIDPVNTNLVNSRVAVDSQGAGVGGDIFVTSNFLNLNNSAIATETFSTDGGNIFLEIGNQLFLQKGSNVTATAGLAQRAGNGGNITVVVPSICQRG